jgi:hypothetical protein
MSALLLPPVARSVQRGEVISALLMLREMSVQLPLARVMSVPLREAISAQLLPKATSVQLPLPGATSVQLLLAEVISVQLHLATSVLLLPKAISVQLLLPGATSMQLLLLGVTSVQTSVAIWALLLQNATLVLLPGVMSVQRCGAMSVFVPPWAMTEQLHTAAMVPLQPSAHLELLLHSLQLFLELPQPLLPLQWPAEHRTLSPHWAWQPRLAQLPPLRWCLRQKHLLVQPPQAQQH